jgi:hypothetical protein
VKLRDLLSFVRGQKALGVATIELSDAVLAATADPQPNLCVLLKTESASTFIYSELWLDYANGHRFVHLLVDPARLVGVTINLVGAHLLSQNLGCYHNVEAVPCPEPPTHVVAWLTSLSGNAVPLGQSITRAAILCLSTLIVSGGHASMQEMRSTRMRVRVAHVSRFT